MFSIFVHLSMNESCLFVLFVPIISIELGMLQITFLVSWKALEEEGCIGLVSRRLDLQCKSS
jgi:hypothetical protein